MYSHLIVHEERCSHPLGNNQNNELKRRMVEGETGGGRNRRKERERRREGRGRDWGREEQERGGRGGGRNRREEGEEEGGSRERFGEGGEGEGGTICTPLWILPGNHTLAESR